MPGHLEEPPELALDEMVLVFVDAYDAPIHHHFDEPADTSSRHRHSADDPVKEIVLPGLPRSGLGSRSPA
jgi:cytosine/adenosine deaminase-related metal-dependent hydrolase